MLLEQINIEINNKLSKASSFTIERFYVPEGVRGIKLLIQAPQEYVNLVLLYDSAYNLRTEMTSFSQGREIRIHELEYLTSPDAKSGIIPSGEWILAFEFKESEVNFDARCLVEVSTDGF